LTKTDEPRAALLDVNALVALAWDSHVHHTRMRSWFAERAVHGWATCPVTESGFVRVSSNPKVLPAPISVPQARQVLASLRGVAGHHFVTDNVSFADADIPRVAGYRQITDAHLLVLARRHGLALLTFDSGLAAMSGGADVELLGVL
jgi:hypothetical protein